jgi:hypothetical protein
MKLPPQLRGVARKSRHAGFYVFSPNETGARPSICLGGTQISCGTGCCDSTHQYCLNGKCYSADP